MKYLLELAKIVTRRKVGKVDLFDETTLDDPNSLYGVFYKGLVEEKYKSDDQAAELIYNTTPLDDKYRQLKSRTKKRLLNHLFFIDINDPSYSDYKKAYLSCYKNLSILKILLANSARNSFEKTAKQTVVQAIKYDFTDIIIICCRHLCSHYSLRADSKKFTEYSDLLNKYLEIFNAEVQAEQLMQEIMLKSAKTSTYSEEHKELANSNSQKVNNLANKYDSYNIKYFSFYLSCLTTQITQDHKKLIETCDAAEQYYEAHPEFYQKEILAMFAVFKISAYLQLRDYKNGEKSAEKCLQFFTEGTNNWLMFLENYFLLAMHTKNYFKAKEIFDKAVNNPKFEYTSQLRQEKWKIFEAYLNYIFVNEKLLEDSEEADSPFKLYKFLNEVPTYTKDKTGYNVAILVLQVLWLLEQGNFDGIIDKAESLRMYSQRHLKKDDSLRSYYFMKMLRKMEQHSFDYHKTLAATENLNEKLISGESSLVSEWEVIPYEYLWEKVILKLKEEEELV